MAKRTFFDDPDYQTALLALLCKDPDTLHKCSNILSAKDFRPVGVRDPTSLHRWVIAERALHFWGKYRQPIKQLLRSELMCYARDSGMDDKKRDGLLAFAHTLLVKKVVGIDEIVERAVQYKREHVKAAAVEELIELQAAGNLTDEAWLNISHRAIATITGESLTPADYYEELETRIERRRHNRYNTNPLLLIDPLDLIAPAIGPQHLGLVLAPYKRGKSLMLIWIALMYSVQRLNVLFFTLEDPLKDVEDRLDAAVSALPLHRLNELPNKLRRRFREFRNMVNGRIRIYDGTDGGMSIARIESLYEQERNTGFVADAVLVDYDDEILPSPDMQKRERRFQFAQIYRDYRQFIARHNLIGWTAAQSKRGTKDKKIVSGDDVAEDISKMRKVTMALSLGRGNLGEDSLHIHLAACRIGKQNIGCDVMSNMDRMLIYDAEATRDAYGNEANQNGEAEIE